MGRTVLSLLSEKVLNTSYSSYSTRIRVLCTLINHCVPLLSLTYFYSLVAFSDKIMCGARPVVYPYPHALSVEHPAVLPAAAVAEATSTSSLAAPLVHAGCNGSHLAVGALGES